jgi:hypothetical protein
MMNELALVLGVSSVSAEAGVRCGLLLARVPLVLSASHTRCVQRVGSLVAVVALTLSAGCTASRAPGSATRGTTTTTAAPAAAPTAHAPGATAHCPVTEALPHSAPPASAVTGISLPLPGIEGWYGNDAFWVLIQTGGELQAYFNRQTQRWQSKLPVWREATGYLSFAARRLNGSSTGFEFDTAGYGTRGFDATRLVWPDLGCWQLTGTVGGKTLTLVTVLKPSGFY